MANLGLRIERLLEATLTSEEEYVDWVRDWKRAHSDLVTVIVFQKSTSRNNRNGAIASFSQSVLAGLQYYATEMYKTRGDNKGNLKAGKYPRKTPVPQKKAA
jgi:hypothetical protein